ncbi:hypothetical protein HXA34_04995 [Salipaludibacillus agaradhaerens]|uniref:hypothetical protein n=1 Tax=Salipaludibacillus agaradhaerens TaxID=76935 RepID=UPI002151B2F3|nr:hypothetical protein [Salipaludibacillus agaradhaerens]MCR6105644.1 hypothetical protein [Salipaludibacillus agaradhaerens]MCR6117681.1 hypothetical protein [Salipaludibacillus agaradhaerens]UJW56866.1 hypothetical protein HXZ66_05265 [Bacillus sp. A116_S68]
MLHFPFHLGTIIDFQSFIDAIDTMFRLMISVILLLIVLLLIKLFIVVGMYTLGSLGLQRLLERENYKKSWMAFIPFVQFHCLGILLKDRKLYEWERTLPTVLVVTSFLNTLSFFFFIDPYNDPYTQLFYLVISTLFLMAVVIVSFRIYQKYTQSALIYTILTILSLGMLFPLLLFTLRNNQY